MSKQYGLIFPNKSKLTPANTIKRPSIFDEESTSEEEVEKPTGLPTVIKRQDRIVREKAVEEDPTVYQYDEIYDKMDQERKDSKLSRKELDKTPKYINKLLAAADKRKRENERRIERQVQKEREAEGDEFKDKESFVTSAYKKKLEELKKQEEEEKREEYLEAIGDVKKQGNLDGFYRHLYDQQVNYPEKIKMEEEVKKETLDKTAPKSKETSPDGDEESTSRNSSHSVSKKHVPHKRTYRKRKSSESDGKEESEDEKKLEHLPSNLDADSDFSIDSDTEESEDESKPKKSKVEEKIKEESKAEDTTLKEISSDKNGIKESEEEKKEIKQETKVIEEVKPKKPKIDIWKKRTVGIVFEEALQRYFERKALREAGK